MSLSWSSLQPYSLIKHILVSHNISFKHHTKHKHTHVAHMWHMCTAPCMLQACPMPASYSEHAWNTLSLEENVYICMHATCMLYFRSHVSTMWYGKACQLLGRYIWLTFSLRRDMTSTWLAMIAPSLAAVNAIERFIRESLC